MLKARSQESDLMTLGLCQMHPVVFPRSSTASIANFGNSSRTMRQEISCQDDSEN